MTLTPPQRPTLPCALAAAFLGVVGVLREPPMSAVVAA
jgi:hypothetical protein